MQGRVTGTLFEELKILVGQLPYMLGESTITIPKRRIGKMPHNSLHFPFAKSWRALTARCSSLPEEASCSNCLSHLSSSNLWNQALNRAKALSGRLNTSFSSSLIFIIIPPPPYFLKQSISQLSTFYSLT